MKAVARSSGKVIFVNRYYYPDESATSQMLHGIASALDVPQREVHVVTSRLLYEGARRSLPPRETVGRVQVHRVWTTAFGRRSRGRALDYLTFYVSACATLIRLAGRGDIVVAKTDPPILSVIAAFAAALKASRLVNWLQDLFPEIVERLSGRDSLRRAVGPLRWLRDWSIRRAEMNVVIGERMRDLVIARGVRPERVSVIHNYADGEEIAPLPRESNRLRAEWDLAGRFVVGYSGNLGRVHDLDTIIEAAEKLRDEVRVAFLFIGEGFQRARLEAMCVERGLTNVAFKPYLPRADLRVGLTVPDVHVVSLHAQIEGLVVPSKIYGAMAAGVPTLFIGDPEGEVAVLLSSPPAAGIVVASGDVEGVVAAIRKLDADPVLAAEMGSSARKRFLRFYDRRVAVSHWATLLSEVEGSNADHG